MREGAIQPLQCKPQFIIVDIVDHVQHHHQVGRPRRPGKIGRAARGDNAVFPNRHRSNSDPHGIRVNAVAPGIVDTKFHDEVDRIVWQQQLGLKPGELMKNQAETIPLGRLAKPEDIASAIAFLVSEEASYITGETLTVGGGKSRL